MTNLMTHVAATQSDDTLLSNLTAEQQDRLSSMLDVYLQTLEQGTQPAANCLSQLAMQHPDLADTFRVYVSSIDRLHDATAGMRQQNLWSSGDSVEPDEKRLGDYRLLREVGRGGMGSVYEAQQVSLDRRVAIKILPLASSLGEKNLARFRNEAAAAAQIQHPNIVPVHSVGSESGVHFYTMPFIDGLPLDQVIASLANDDQDNVADFPAAAKSDRWQFAVEIGIQAANALHAAHEVSVIHRDIKPSNLLIDSSEKLWITDFGLARCQQQDGLTQTGDLVGTLRYMSPEQAAAQPERIDHRTDIYSLGATLYELVTLTSAFEEVSGSDLLFAVGHKDPPRISKLCPNIPRDLEAVIDKAMTKERDGRYVTAKALADDLTAVLNGTPTQARPITAVRQAGRWINRHQSSVVLGAVACLILAAILSGVTAFALHKKMVADQNFDRAERNFKTFRTAIDRIGVRLGDELRGIPGAETVRRDMLLETLTYYQDFVEQSGYEPDFQYDLARAYSRMGELNEQVGQFADAVTAYQQAAGRYATLANQLPDDLLILRSLGLCKNNLGAALAKQDKYERAMEHYRDAVEHQRGLIGRNPHRRAFRADLAITLNNVGQLATSLADSATAFASLEESMRLCDALLDDGADDDRGVGGVDRLQSGQRSTVVLESQILRIQVANLNNLGTLLANSEMERALKLHAKAIDLSLRMASLNKDRLQFRSDVAVALNVYGSALMRANQLENAIMRLDQAREIQDLLVAAAPNNPVYAQQLAITHNNLALARSRNKQPQQAKSNLSRAHDLLDLWLSRMKHDAAFRRSYRGVCHNLAKLEEQDGNIELAETLLQKGDELGRPANRRSPDSKFVSATDNVQQSIRLTAASTVSDSESLPRVMP